MTKGKMPWDSKVLDGRYCNQLWLELKTLSRVQKRLTDEGIRSPRTGKEISRPAIAMAVWRWCCNNPDESYQIEKQARAVSGEVLTRDLWNVELISHASRAFTPVGYRKWLERNKLEDVAKRYAISI